MESVLTPSKSRLPLLLTLPEIASKSPNLNVSFKTPPKVFSDAHLIHLCKNNRLHEAVTLLDSIARCGSKVSPNTFAHLLNSCIKMKSLSLGRKIHNCILGYCKESVLGFVETKLMYMYVVCGGLEDAYEVFDRMLVRDLHTWSSMISAFSRERKWGDVVELFYMMMDEAVVVDVVLVPKILQACGNRRDVETGRLIHSMVVRSGMISEIRVSNSILAVYAKCGEIDDADRFFKTMEVRDRVSWNAIITGYCQKGDIEGGMRLFELMKEDGADPGLVTWNILISSYNLLGRCDVAKEMMKEMDGCGIEPDIFTWTAMISGFVQDNTPNQALEVFEEMVLDGVEPNAVAFISGIAACAMLKDVRKGRELHSLAIKVGLGEDVLVRNSLINMYSKSGKLDLAHQVFAAITNKDVYSWNSMIAGYCQAGYSGKAHDIFMKMQESGVLPNVITWNVLITGYIQSGDEDRAMDLFKRMETEGNVKRNQASWNALIAGYLQNGFKDKALMIFRKMLSFTIKPNSITILSILPACANLIAAKMVKEIHCFTLRCGLTSDLSVSNCLIDTYAKSGNLRYSEAIFEKMSARDAITWNTLMAAYVLHGCSRKAIKLFDLMVKVGPKPNRGTFVSIISAYSLAQMVCEGKKIFCTMVEQYHIQPWVDHYEAMITLYGRSGKLEECLEFIDSMEIKPDFRIWAAFLTACRVHGNIRLAIHAGEQLLRLDPANGMTQWIVCQLYSVAEIEECSLKLKKPSRRNAPQQSVGCSWIEYNNSIHSFASSHQHEINGEAIYTWITNITEKSETQSHVDHLTVEEEEKEESGRIHSEKIALAVLLISPQKSQSIRIVKNMRMCQNCHRTAKYISKAYGCDIYLYDSKCFHHFKDGNCSCGDYW
ncbi:hypothetical protein Leryth_010590 [Lithospermum erythrorhizon]|nr:hypothetical protein Leryth_010590 [Lithospermum erythrorhizon]